MNSRTFFFWFLIFLTSAGFGQNREFEDFANLSDSLMHKAYEQRNPMNYLLSLNKFNEEYSKLSDKDKEYYKGFRINAFYNLSCSYSLLNDKTNAIIYLKKSLEAGYNDYAHIQQDSDLDNIRKEEAFLKLVRPYQEINDYLYILKKAGKYNLQKKQEIPIFTYQSSNNPNLVNLRKTFNLDSVAGNATEVSKILNILHWVHNSVSHDGSNDSGIKNINAYAILTAARTRHIGVCCGELATTLNDCYLAMGWASRKVYCYPKDSLGTDNDKHVINVVYLPSMHKWIWVDPTNDAYVMDEKQQLLSIEDVRNRLINDKPLILNPDANWNHKSTVFKEFYLYSYMAKNLYMMECPINSEYDSETKNSGKTITYIQLIPLDYHKKSLKKEVSVNKEAKTTIITYWTNNPDIFWQTP
jgi:hypothetical protein